MGAETSRKPVYALPGILLILAGVFLSSAGIATGLQGPAGLENDALLTGALWFRAGLVVLGVYWLFLYALPVRVLDPLDGNDRWPGKGHFVFLGGLIGLAAALRLIELGNGIWYDEMLTHVRYMGLTPGEIVSTYDDANNHVLFTLAAKVSLMAFGDTDWAFRLPAALFGIASVMALYVFARQVSTPLVALFSVALVTVSYHHIWFSQNARGYTALLFFSIVSSSFLLAALKTNRPWLWGMFALTGALGAFTHLSMGFLSIGQGLVWLGTEIRERRTPGRQWWVGLLFGFVPLALLTYQSYALVLPPILDGALLGSGLQDERLDWLNPLWALMEIYYSLRVGFAGGVVGSVVVLGAGLVLAVGLIHFLIRRAAVVVLFVVPCGLGFALMTAIGYTLFPRFFFFAMGFAIVIVIGGAVTLAEIANRILAIRGRAAIWLPALACLAIVGASVLSLRFVYAPKQMFERAIAHIEESVAPGDRVVALGIADFPFNDYYRKGWTAVDTLADLDAVRAETEGRTWVVYTMPLHARTVYADVLAVLETDYEAPESFVGTLNGGGIVVAAERMSGDG